MAHIWLYGPEGLWKGSIPKPRDVDMGQRPSGPGQDGPYRAQTPYMGIWALLARAWPYWPEGLWKGSIPKPRDVDMGQGLARMAHIAIYSHI